MIRNTPFQLEIITATILALVGCHSATQQADLSFEPSIPRPAYSEGKGPVVQIDEAHFNFHTGDGRYALFSPSPARRSGSSVSSTLC